MKRRDEQGQLTVLIIGFTAIILLMIVVVTDISKVFLVRRDLDATADGAVLAAAIGLAAIYAQPAADGNAELDPDEARRLTAEYLDQVAASNRFDGLDWSADVAGTNADGPERLVGAGGARSRLRRYSLRVLDTCGTSRVQPLHGPAGIIMAPDDAAPWGRPADRGALVSPGTSRARRGWPAAAHRGRGP